MYPEVEWSFRPTHRYSIFEVKPSSLTNLSIKYFYTMTPIVSNLEFCQIIEWKVIPSWKRKSLKHLEFQGPRPLRLKKGFGFGNMNKEGGQTGLGTVRPVIRGTKIRDVLIDTTKTTTGKVRVRRTRIRPPDLVLVIDLVFTCSPLGVRFFHDLGRKRISQ